MVVGALANRVDEVERCLAPVERASTRGRVRHVALHPIEGGLAFPRTRGVSSQAPYPPPLARERRSDRTTDESGGADFSTLAATSGGSTVVWMGEGVSRISPIGLWPLTSPREFAAGASDRSGG
jgi:hypothetical protein